jgi:hypothetical protein
MKFPRTLRTLCVFAMASAFLITSRVSEGAEVSLQIEALVDGFGFRLEGDAHGSPWVLQHSSDGTDWDDLLFLDLGEGEEREPRVSISKAALPKAEAPLGFFRARRLEAEDRVLRDFLAARVKWRLTGFDSYQYELRQNFGAISWHGTVTVIDGDVSSFETIDLQPPVVEVPDVPTIGGLFSRIANAMASDAETIDVAWHPDFGYPATCYIDFDLLLADEEQGWTIESFTPFR